MRFLLRRAHASTSGSSLAVHFDMPRATVETCKSWIMPSGDHASRKDTRVHQDTISINFLPTVQTDLYIVVFVLHVSSYRCIPSIFTLVAVHLLPSSCSSTCVLGPPALCVRCTFATIMARVWWLSWIFVRVQGEGILLAEG